MNYCVLRSYDVFRCVWSAFPGDFFQEQLGDEYFSHHFLLVRSVAAGRPISDEKLIISQAN